MTMPDSLAKDFILNLNEMVMHTFEFLIFYMLFSTAYTVYVSLSLLDNENLES